MAGQQFNHTVQEETARIFRDLASERGVRIGQLLDLIARQMSVGDVFMAAPKPVMVAIKAVAGARGCFERDVVFDMLSCPAVKDWLREELSKCSSALDDDVDK